MQQSIIRLKACQRCKGDCFYDWAEQEFSCMQCGAAISISGKYAFVAQEHRQVTWPERAQ